MIGVGGGGGVGSVGVQVGEGVGSGEGGGGSWFRWWAGLAQVVMAWVRGQKSKQSRGLSKAIVERNKNQPLSNIKQ